MRMLRPVVIALLAASCGMAFGVPVNPDRPKQAQSSGVIDPGFFQIEAGYRYSDDDETDRERSALPQALVRIGLMPNVELRLGWDGYQYQETGGGRVSDGIGDAEVGAKLYLCPEEGRRPELAFLGSVNIPLGDDDFSSDEADPQLLVLASQTVSDYASLHYNAGVRWREEGDDSESFFNYAVAWAYRWTDEITGYVELFGDIALSADEDRHSLDLGMTYHYTSSMAFDVFLGTGLSDEAEDVFAGFGATFLLP